MSPKEKKENENTAHTDRSRVCRSIFTVSFIISLAYITTRHNSKQTITLEKQDCLVDQTFLLTQELNKFFTDNTTARDWVIVFNSFWFDVTVCGLLFMFWQDRLKSVSFAMALTITALTKQMI